MAERKQMEDAYRFAEALCRSAGEEKAFLDHFWADICKEADILEEFCYYMEHQKFACSVSVKGYTVIDIMVWQIDHFKAQLDRDNRGIGDNGSRMLVRAFDTFVKMRKEPEKYIRMFQEETGTDYPEKY